MMALLVFELVVGFSVDVGKPESPNFVFLFHMIFACIFPDSKFELVEQTKGEREKKIESGQEMRRKIC